MPAPLITYDIYLSTRSRVMQARRRARATGSLVNKEFYTQPLATIRRACVFFCFAQNSIYVARAGTVWGWGLYRIAGLQGWGFHPPSPNVCGIAQPADAYYGTNSPGLGDFIPPSPNPPSWFLFRLPIPQAWAG